MVGLELDIMRNVEISAPRLAAFHALLSWKNGHGFVQGNLQKTCESLPQNDRALAYEIALGTCRNLAYLDEKLKSLMRKLPEEPCKTILEISLYQLLYTRIPPYAVVNSAVDLTRHIGLNDRTKFINAVLRNAIRKNFPRNLENNSPPQWIRINPQKTTIEEITANLNLQDPKILFNKFILIPQAGEALRNPLFEKGHYSFQDPASFFVAKMCEIKSGQKIWDACAAPGGKTAMLAEENPDAFFIASDHSEKRAKKLFDLQNRLGLKNVQIAIASAENPPFSQKFDCIILDAPCSNMGVANRRPEVLQNISKEKIKDFGKRQLAILKSVSAMAKAGGTIIYSVCSQEKEETSEVIENCPNLVQEDFIFTDMPDIDKFFVAKLRKI
jgi:16S rRNA (cytosine967-C5)-methyltransferase